MNITAKLTADDAGLTEQAAARAMRGVALV